MNSVLSGESSTQQFGPDKRPPLMMHGEATRRNDAASLSGSVPHELYLISCILPTSGDCLA
jgi:hypothetical protein